MIHLLKKGFILLVTLCLFIFLLGIYLSGSNLKGESYYQVIDYSNPVATSDSILKVMTFNMGYLSGMTNNRSILREEILFNKRLEKVKDLMRKVDPSIIGFQEIDFEANRSFNVNQLDSVAKGGDYASAYKSINWDKKYVPFPYWPPSNHFGRMLSGQAILSRYSIKPDRTLILNPNMEKPFWYRAFYLDRLLQIAEIDFHGEKVKIMNVHLEAFDRDTRLLQIDVVKSEFEKYAGKQPVILMGDFNSKVPSQSEELDAIDLLMDTKWIASAIPFDQESRNRTFPSDDPIRMIDYIFYNENFIKCSEAKVLKEIGQVSDHLSVFAKFELKFPNKVTP